MKRINFFLASMVGLVLVLSSQVRGATIIANAQGDFVPGTNNGDTGPFSATGTGSWSYLGSDTENPTLDTNGFDDLVWSTASNRYHFTANAEPLVADGGTELLVHPGQNAPQWGVLRWTAGLGEGGLVNISGVFRKFNLLGTSVTGALFVDGVLLDSVTLAGNDGVGHSFDFDIPVSEGSLFDFVIGTNGSSTGDMSAVNITIMSIPEPSTLALLLCSGIGLLTCQHRQKQRAV